MKKEQIQVGCYTIIGDRKSQQDTMQYAWKGDDTVLAVVCDGMCNFQKFCGQFCDR